MADPEKGAVPLEVLDHKYGRSAHASEGGWRKVTAAVLADTHVS